MATKTIIQSRRLLFSTKQVEMQNKYLCSEACAGAEAIQTSAGQIYSSSGLLPSHSSALLFPSENPTNAICYNACSYTDAPLRWWIRAVESILPWLPQKANALPLPSLKSALEIHMLNTAASY